MRGRRRRGDGCLRVCRGQKTDMETPTVTPINGSAGTELSVLGDVGAEVRLPSGAVITRTGLRFERRPSLDEFRGTAEIVFGIFKHSRFITLDMLKVGRKEFGDATMRTVTVSYTHLTLPTKRIV